MFPSFSEQLLSELDSIRNSDRFRVCPIVTRTSPVDVTVDGIPLVSFCSNDYLGMSCHPALIEAARESFYRSGLGASASRLVSGTFPEHLALEAALSSLVGTEATLLFPSGYQANLGAITALAGPGDVIVADRAVHASIIDACRLSRAKLAFYPHCDLTAADKHLRRLAPASRRTLLVTESLFSMDGDVAPLPDLAALAQSTGAALLVDEAHAIGSLGPGGAGLCAHFGVRPDALVGTLGKTIGVSGAFVAGTTILRSFLVNQARSFLFTTAMPPPMAAAALASLQHLTSDKGEQLRRALATASSALRTQLFMPPGAIPSPILPWIIGDASSALTVSARLREAGFFVQAIRHPTVPEGSARLRITVSAHHTPHHLTDLATALPTTTSPPLTPTPPSIRTIPTPILSGLVLLGTDTAVGKTTIACALLHILRARGHSPVPFKPVETGSPSQHQPSDADRLQQAAARHDLPPDVICPFHFPHPVAPIAASESAGKPLLPTDLLAAAEVVRSYGSPLLVETSGGILTPYADHFTSIDLASALRLPVLLVARNALGTVNHTALAVAEILRRSITLLGIILVQTTPSTTPDQASNASLIGRCTGLYPLGALPHLPSANPSSLAKSLQERVDLEPILSLFPPRS